MFFYELHWPDLLLYALAGVTCFRIVNARHTPTASVSWIWAVISFPFLAVPLYWFVGGRRVKGFTPIWATLPDRRRFVSLMPVEGIRESFQQIFPTFGDVYEVTSGQASLLVDGKETYSAIFQGISQAQSYILVQYYILRSDRLGKALRKLLITKAQQGVKVFVLIDHVGSIGLGDDFLFRLRRAGVEFAHFLPLYNFSRMFFVNNRNHRKLVVVDGDIAYAGGLNVGREYLSSRDKRWRDTHLAVGGKVVKKLETIFWEDWFFATGSRPIPRLKPPEDKISLSVKDLSKVNFSPLYDIQVIPTGPYDRNNIGGMVFSTMIQSAKKRLWVATPYFIPDEQLQRDLEIAVLRGVDVRLILPRAAEKIFVHWVTLSYAEQIQRNGIKVYLYEPGILHQKVILIDDEVASVSTSNFDNRAMYLNFETNILVLDPRFVKQVEEMLKRDLEYCSNFVPSRRKIRRLFKIRDNGARILAPLL